MSLRLRLAIWYAGIASVAIAAVVVTAYAIHNHASFVDVDRALSDDAAHFATVLEAERVEGTPHRALPSLPADSRTLVRFYDARGEPLVDTGSAAPAPPISVADTLAAQAGPLYDRLFAWLPGGRNKVEGSFATARGEQGDRIRLYAVPTLTAEGSAGYVQTWTSLAGIDRSMRRFRVLIFGLGAGGVATTWAASLLVAGAALRPVATMTRTARAIAVSRGFSRRVPEPARRDELGELAHTFNEMLASLEEAYRAQQRFVADAAHELRAPLTAIQGNIELLARVPDMPPDHRAEAMSYLDREATRLARLVNELLTLARADAGQQIERRPVELDAVVLEAVAELRVVPHGERLAVDAAEPMAVSGDAYRLKQLTLILLDNALKYTPDDGAVRVRLARSDGDSVLEVVDNGIGIPAEALPDIFERFYRADPARGRDPGGSGLGLAIARWIVEQHEGQIAVESAVGRGTTVTVRLPLLPAPEPRARAALDADVPAAG